MTYAEVPPAEAAAIERAFGEVNRRRILDGYFDGVDDLSFADAWEHVYRLLLWINPTISLAHCYESDKCQPHKAWYARSLAFHAWVAQRLAVEPRALRDHIDHLFRSALPALVRVEVDARREAAGRHLQAYPSDSMPVPGDDDDLVEIIVKALGSTVSVEALEPERRRALVEQVYAYFAQENKRKNLLGRGFEDTLKALIEPLPGHEQWQVDTRVALGRVPGFTPHNATLRRAEIDLALWQPQPGGRRVLVSAKWSVRADRERQFDSDFDDYSTANSAGLFEYSLITNEFDAARLHSACRKLRGNQYLFTHVVHVQPKAVLVAYGREAEAQAQRAGGAGRRAARELLGYIKSGRLVSLERWLTETLGP